MGYCYFCFEEKGEQKENDWDFPRALYMHYVRRENGSLSQYYLNTPSVMDVISGKAYIK